MDVEKKKRSLKHKMATLKYVNKLILEQRKELKKVHETHLGRIQKMQEEINKLKKTKESV